MFVDFAMQIVFFSPLPPPSGILVDNLFPVFMDIFIQIVQILGLDIKLGIKLMQRSAAFFSTKYGKLPFKRSKDFTTVRYKTEKLGQFMNPTTNQ